MIASPPPVVKKGALAAAGCRENHGGRVNQEPSRSGNSYGSILKLPSSVSQTWRNLLSDGCHKVVISLLKRRRVEKDNSCVKMPALRRMIYHRKARKHSGIVFTKVVNVGCCDAKYSKGRVLGSIGKEHLHSPHYRSRWISVRA